MNLQQLGTLTRLFDEIKQAVDQDVLEYKWVKESLKNVFAGNQLEKYEGLVVTDSLVRLGSFVTEGVSEVKELPWTEPSRPPRSRSQHFKGLDNFSLDHLGPFFTGSAWPATEGGESHVFECVKNRSIGEMVDELFKTPNIPVEDIVGAGFSFSFAQVVKIMSLDKVSKVVSLRRRSLIFLVHDETKTNLRAIMIRGSKIYDRDLDSPYAYAAGVLIVARTLPKSLR